jgi:hypothetical protein
MSLNDEGGTGDGMIRMFMLCFISLLMLVR